MSGRPLHMTQVSAQDAGTYYANDAWLHFVTSLTALIGRTSTMALPAMQFILPLHDQSKTIRLRLEPYFDQHGSVLHGIAETIEQDGLAASVPPTQNHTMSLPALLNALTVGIAFVDHDLRYQFFNTTYLEWFSLPASASIGKSVEDTIGKEIYLSLKQSLQMALRGVPATSDATITDRHGVTRSMTTKCLPAYSNRHTIIGCYVFVHDNTQYQQAEEELRLTENRWQMALEGCGDGVWDWYPQLGIEILSDRLKAIYGYGPHEVSDFSEELDRRTHPEDLDKMLADRIAHFEGLTPIYINEHRVQCKDGSWKWILSRGTVIQRDEHGNPLRVVGTHTDISEQKKADVALKESEGRLRMALSATHQGLYDLNIQTGDTIVNAEYANMLGYEHANFIENKAAWLERMHPEDIRSADRAYSNYQNGLADEYRVEFRQRKASGDWIWVLSVGALVEWDNDGNPLRMLGTVLDITEKKKSEALIWQQANMDSLTGLPNRRSFYDRVDYDIKKSKRTGLQLGVLFIDLDFFKEVNDTLGHATGDALLVEAANRLRHCVREYDTVARLGGDEFTVSIPDQHDHLQIEKIAQKIIQQLSAPFSLANEQIFLSASIGITLYPRDADNANDLLKHADQAMYAAKGSGRNRFSYFTPDLQTAAQARLRLNNELRTAIAEKHLQVYFQPIIDLNTGHIRKAEALIRWHHAQMGYISPPEFIPIAETSGLIHHIGDWVFEQSLIYVQQWRERFHPEFQISVNQSPVEFQADDGRYAGWIQKMRDLNLPGQAIVIEITEGLLLDASNKIFNQLLQFRDAGIAVAIDDFGTGYSSLSYLNKFDIDYLKIDQSFVRNLAPGSSESALSEAMIMMAHKLGLRVIAEGVETEEQRALLSLATCDFAQGYLFAKPLPPEEFEQLLETLYKAE
ncbi:sensor domain-containing protein [Undibacterium sp. SXout7W]